MKKVRIENPFRPIYPSPAGLIVSVDSAGKPNVMTAGEIFNVGLKDPAIIGIALRKATYTHGLIVESKQFTVNLATSALLEQVDLIGTISGRDGFDKFSAYGLTPLKSDKLEAPIIGECPVNLECRMLSVAEVGDHDLFLGEVVAMHVDEDVVNEKQQVEIQRADCFLFGEWGYYKVGEKLADFGFSRKKKAGSK